MSQPATEVSEGPNQGLLLALIGDKASARMKQALSLYFMVATAWRIGQRWHEKVRTETTFTVAITGSDDLYPDVHGWLLEKLPPHRRRSLIARSSRSGSAEVSLGNPDPKPAFHLLYDGDRRQKVTLDGHEIEVQVERIDVPPRGDGSGLDGWLAQSKRIVFSARSVEGREAILRFLAEVASKREKREPRLFVGWGWGGWSRQSDVPSRSLDSVILRSGQREALVGDIAEFLGLEAAYGAMGIPWHRGLLFWGPPGTGKTSAAKALAGHFRLDVYYLSLPAITNDSSLLELLTGVEPRSLLLIEDIDVVHNTHDRARTDNNPGVTLGGLLNALDGFVTPHGLITVMTTNDRDILDAALVRPGRVDRHEEFPLLDDDQLARLASTFLGRRVDLPPLAGPVSPAEGAIAALKRLVG